MLVERVFSFYAFKALGDSEIITQAGTFTAIMSGVIIIELFKGVSAYFSFNIESWIKSEAIHNLRLSMMHKFLFARWKNLEELDRNDVLSRIENDAPSWTDFIGEVTNVVITLPGLIVVLFIAIIYDWKLCLLAFVFCMLSNYFLSNWLAKFMTTATENIQAALSNNLGKLLICVKAANKNRWYARNEEIEKDFEEASKATYRAVLHKERYSCVRTVIDDGFTYLADILFLGIGSYMCYKELINLGVFLAIYSVRTVFFSPIALLTSLRSAYRECIAFGKRVTTILDLPQETALVSPAADIMFSKSPAIQFDNVSFSYCGQRFALKDLSFIANGCKMTALRGPSGSGKSTIFKLIMGLLTPEDGHIYIGEIPLNMLSLYALRQSITYLSQDPYLFNDTIANNIKFFKPDATKEQISKVAETVNAHSFISEFNSGYDTMLNNNAQNISHGQRQRIILARALLKNSPIILMDEITSNLDKQTELSVAETISKLLMSKTVLLISHGDFLNQYIDKDVVI